MTNKLDAYLEISDERARAYRAWEDDPTDPAMIEAYNKFIGPSDEAYQELTRDEKIKLSKISKAAQARHAPGH